MKFNFNNDYGEACHEKIIAKIAEISYESNPPYGLDKYSKHAEELIQQKCHSQSDVFFLIGGTQVNLVFISSVLKPFEAVIACETGHINVHETGAIEATGHKVVTVKAINGKVTPSEVEKCIAYHCDEHMVHPRMVYISNSTELGTIYCKEEIIALNEVCQKHNLYFYCDGARLGAALTANGNDLTLEDLAKYTDAFYIGGTKNGALFGEALVINNKDLAKNYRFIIKQRGAMLAKGYLIGVQFEELFKDNLYFEIAQQENDYAQQIKNALLAKGFKFFIDSPTNQLFPILTQKQVDELDKEFVFSVWQKNSDDEVVIRLVTSFTTNQAQVDALIAVINSL